MDRNYYHWCKEVYRSYAQNFVPFLLLLPFYFLLSLIHFRPYLIEGWWIRVLLTTGYIFAWEYLEYLEKVRDSIVINQFNYHAARCNAETKIWVGFSFFFIWFSFLPVSGIRKWVLSRLLKVCYEGTTINRCRWSKYWSERSNSCRF